MYVQVFMYNSSDDDGHPGIDNHGTETCMYLCMYVSMYVFMHKCLRTTARIMTAIQGSYNDSGSYHDSHPGIDNHGSGMCMNACMYACM